jgi:hypothetical protein
LAYMVAILLTFGGDAPARVGPLRVAK